MTRYVPVVALTWLLTASLAPAQQEHWRMGPGARGIGAHRTWLPWISVNHLHGITGLEKFDRALYQQLAKGK